MKVLYIGDIMARPGREVVKKMLPGIKADEKIDFVIAQGENLSHGKGMELKHIREMQNEGVDFFTGGNHTLKRKAVESYLNDPASPVVRPANYPEDAAGSGYKIIEHPTGKVLVVSLLGQIVPTTPDYVTNPLVTIDSILKEHEGTNLNAIIVNFHGDYSSEKLVIGQYLDGRVSAVIGDHWHVQTADDEVLPKGTAHITDVGMCGSLDSSLGVKTDAIVRRWRDEKITRNVLENNGRMQFSALAIDIDEKTRKAKEVKRIHKVL